MLLRFFYILSMVFVFYTCSFSLASEEDYFAIPPFLSQQTYANLMLVLDYSGSMSWWAYLGSYTSNRTYYGYFNPEVRYSCSGKLNKGNLMSCKGYWYENRNGSYLGNYLNWYYMTRIDILRLILTGGKIEGGFIETYSGEKIRVEDVVSYNPKTGKVEGILQKIERKKTKPRIGLVIFQGGNPITHWIYPTYRYESLISIINNSSPEGATPTGEALDEVYKYFSLKDGTWGGFSKNSWQYLNPYIFLVNGNPIEVRCAKNFVVLISDGAWNGHSFSNKKIHCDGDSYLVKDPVDAGYKYSCAIDPASVSYKMWTEDLVSHLEGKQKVETFTVYAFGNDVNGKNALENTAIFGSFKDKDGDSSPCGYTTAPPSPQCDENQSPPCGSFVQVKTDSCREWDFNGDGIPDNFFYGNTPESLENAILNIFKLILKRISSGTSVCALSEKNKLGNISIQALFYPEKNFDNYSLNWLGYLYSWWLFSSKSNQNLREDTNENKILDVDKDYILEWSIDETTGDLTINAYNSTLTGGRNSKVDSYSSFDQLHPLWEGGDALLGTEESNRKIYTTDGESLILFNEGNLSKFGHYLGNTASFPSCLKESGNPANNLVLYIRGKDFPNCRSRTINGKVWKLGDIVYSTPTIVNYGKYNVVFVGANDGMLHAFYGGYVKKLLSSTQVAQLQNSKDDINYSKLGKELWTFIPKNTLPYLRYLPDPNYKHIYFVDLKPYVYTFKDSSGKTRRILIGGMRLGGATGCQNNSCVNPPLDTCSDTNLNSCVGLSSYFALDVTDPVNPKFLWEFSHKDLGFSYSGPAIIKKGNRTYVLFGSGPTNYKGDSGQSLTLFVLDLFSGNLVETFNRFISGSVGQGEGSEIRNAFCGRLFTEGFDYNEDGITDYLFFGYARKDGDMNNWKGGLILGDVRSNDPEEWSFHKYFEDAQSPITAKVEVENCFGRPYIFFGTGRWFYKEDNSLPGQRNRLYGVALECGSDGCKPNLNVAHSSSDVCNDLRNGVVRSWYIELDGNEGNYLKERLLSDPIVTKSNIVFFATTQPNSDPCSFGGRSRVWGLNCITGGSFSEGCQGSSSSGQTYTPEPLYGTLLLQLSSGNVEQIRTVKEEFTENGNLTTRWFIGVTPETSIPIVIPQTWIGELLLWIER